MEIDQIILIKGGTIVNADEQFQSDVLISNGIIQQVGKNLQAPERAKIIDAQNLLVMPGGIDTHTHLQLPFMGTTTVDDFDLGTRAAIAGGTTTIMDFVIPKKGESLLKAYNQWMSWAKPKVNCNFGFHIAITSWNDNIEEELVELVEKGISSIKVFNAYKGVMNLDNAGLILVMETAKKLGMIVMAHCENPDLIERNQNLLMKLGVTGPEGHYLSRDEEIEALGTRNMITIANQVNSPLYVVHVQSKPAADEIVRAINKGFLTFGETLCTGFTCDGKMLWDKDWKKASRYVMSPPINPDITTHDYLLNRLNAGLLQTVATDNCTFCAQTKWDLGNKGFTSIPNGCNGIEDRISITWNQGVNQGFFSPCKFVAVTSYNAAKIFNLYPRKGVIRIGSDADIIIFDPQAEKIISAKTHFQAVDTNVFEGMHVKGLTVATILNGKLVFQNGVLNTKKGQGQYLKRLPFGFPFERMEALDNKRDPLKQKVDRSGIIEHIPTVEELNSLKKQIELITNENKNLKNQLNKIE